MSYLLFHLIFILPPIFILCWLNRRSLNLASWGGLLLISFIALVYTIPWDSHLINKGVWTYPTSAVIMTIGNIPLEEYFFMILQPILTGLIALKFLSNQKTNLAVNKDYRANLFGFLFWLALSGLGFYLFKGIKTYYMGFILIWASPILALQWAYGGEVLWRFAKTHFIILFLVTIYLCIADRIAIQAGIWHIEEMFSTEIFVFGLPIEELVFFSITNLLVIYGVSLIKFKSPNELFREKTH